MYGCGVGVAPPAYYSRRGFARRLIEPDFAPSEGISRSTIFSTASVKLGKDRGEHNESGVPQKAEIVGTLSHFRVGHMSRHGVCDLFFAGGLRPRGCS